MVKKRMRRPFSFIKGLELAALPAGPGDVIDRPKAGVYSRTLPAGRFTRLERTS